MSQHTNGNKRQPWLAQGFLSEQGEGALSSATIQAWGSNKNLSRDSVLNESALFAFNARAEYRLNCNKTAQCRQENFHSKSNLLLISWNHDVYVAYGVITMCL
jgi:hypothetical protein